MLSSPAVVCRVGPHQIVGRDDRESNIKVGVVCDNKSVQRPQSTKRKVTPNLLIMRNHVVPFLAALAVDVTWASAQKRKGYIRGKRPSIEEDRRRGLLNEIVSAATGGGGGGGDRGGSDPARKLSIQPTKPPKPTRPPTRPPTRFSTRPPRRPSGMPVPEPTSKPTSEPTAKPMSKAPSKNPTLPPSTPGRTASTNENTVRIAESKHSGSLYHKTYRCDCTAGRGFY